MAIGFETIALGIYLLDAQVGLSGHTTPAATSKQEVRAFIAVDQYEKLIHDPEAIWVRPDRHWRRVTVVIHLACTNSLGARCPRVQS